MAESVEYWDDNWDDSPLEIRYNLNLDVWQSSAWKDNRLGERYFVRGGEARLERYLTTRATLEQTYVGKQLARRTDVVEYQIGEDRFVELRDTAEPLGEIVGILEPWNGDGYWIVKKDGKVDIFRGSSDIRPLTWVEE